LGHVTQHWNRKIPGGSSSSDSGVLLLIEGGGGAFKTTTTTTTPSKGTVGRQSLYSASDTPSLRSQSAFLSNSLVHFSGQATASSGGGLSILAQEHATVVQKLSQTGRHPAPNVCSSFLSLSKNINVDSVGITGVDENGLSKADLIGYKSALELLASMTGETRYKKTAPGLFSSICFHPKQATGDSATAALSLSVCEKKHFLALGAKDYLELQQLKLDVQEIDDAIQSGRVALSYTGSDGQTRKQRLKSYIRHMHRTGNMYVHDIDPRDIAIFPDESASSISDGACPLWPFIYYCLIWGDLKLAIEELSRCAESRMSVVEPEIITVLQIFRSLQQPYANAGQDRQDLDANEIKSKLFVKDITPTNVKQLSAAMSVCHELYQRELDESAERGIDPYRLLVLNLVSLSDKEILTDPGISHHVYTMQTYLWANVWFSIFERWSTLLVHGAGALQKSSLSMDKG